MEWNSNFTRQTSRTCAGLDFSSWCTTSRRRTAGFSRRFAESDYDDEDFDVIAMPSQSKWRVLWRRIVKEKRKILNSSAPVHVAYDVYTYAQNFDDGSACAEPENLSRSFSARFADPSRMLRRRP